MHPFFSIVLCTYNRAPLLPRALRSVLAQTEHDWELIVVDDGSTDETPSVVQNYAAADGRIRYTRHDNVGLARSRNVGLGLARGLFVTFLDSDDEYLPGHLASRRRMLLDNPDVTFIHGGIEVIGDPYVIDKNPPHGKIHVDQCVVGGTFVIRRDVLNGLGGFPLVAYADDAALFEKADTMRDILIAKTDEPTYRYYRDTPDSMASTFVHDSSTQSATDDHAS
jgi:glycosyltransferase involved in cell wall biosynthesis